MKEPFGEESYVAAEPMMPLVINPMLAQTAEAPFDSAQHLFEIKWDGIRGLALIEGNRVRLQSRQLTEITCQFVGPAPMRHRVGRRTGRLAGGQAIP